MGKFGLKVYPIHFVDSRRVLKGEERAIRVFSQIFKRKYPKLFSHVTKIKDERLFTYIDVKDKYKIFQDLPNIVNNLAYVPRDKHHILIISGGPPRLGLFAFKAYEYAYFLRYKKNILINTIFMGITPEDSRYLRETTLTVLRSINLYLCLALGNFEWQFTAPLEKDYRFYFTKTDLVRYAVKSGLPLDKTWSCGFQSYSHCGRCYNCVSRKIVLKKAGYVDHTVYRRLMRISKLKRLGRRIIVYCYKLMLGYFYKFMSKFFEPKTLSKSGMTDATKVLSVNRKIVWHETVINSLYILDPNTGVIEEFNSTGAFIWKIIGERSRSYYQLIQALKKRYPGTDEKVIEKDLLKFLKRCLYNDYLVLN